MGAPFDRAGGGAAASVRPGRWGPGSTEGGGENWVMIIPLTHQRSGAGANCAVKSRLMWVERGGGVGAQGRGCGAMRAWRAKSHPPHPHAARRVGSGARGMGLACEACPGGGEGLFDVAWAGA